VIDPEVFGGTGFCSSFPGGDSSWITVLVLVGPVVRWFWYLVRYDAGGNNIGLVNPE